ncbi:MAG TPA: hypothetical protein DCM14_01095 [Clostridiales bacterium UBA8153]|nr:hypothetical protein [Clostridiales bacterium UBA8153]
MPGNDGERQKRRRWHLPLAGALLGLLAASAGVLVAGGTRYDRSTTIGGIDVGGLSPQEARSRLEQALDLSRRVLVLEARPGESYTLHFSELGLVPDIDASLAQARVSPWWRSAPQRLALIVHLDAQAFDRAAQALKQAVERSPVSAALVFSAGGRVEVSPHSYGTVLDTGALRQVVWPSRSWDALPTHAQLPLTRVEPEVTQEELAALGIEFRLAEFSTNYRAGEPRADNIALAAAAINGTLLGPGEEFSFNEVVGPRSAERGYRAANTFYGHRVVPGIGGGVCQVSTTLYNAILLADLELVQRFNHSLIVDYVPWGRDAAVAFDEDLDLRFRNSTRRHVLVRASAGAGTLTVGIYGQGPEDLRVTISTRLVRTLPYGTQTILDPSLPAGKTVVVEGRAGKVVAAEAQVFAGGRYTIRRLPSSVYLPIPTVVRVGTHPGL